MEKIRFILIIVLVTFLFSIANGQLKETIVVNWDLTYSHEIKPDPEMQSILDSVYPGVKFLVLGFGPNPAHFTHLFMIYNSDTLIADGNSRRIQLDLAFLDDTTFRYSTETMLKAFIFLDLIEKQGTLYKGNNTSLSEINLIPGVTDFSQSDDPNYRYLDSARRYINMKAIVKLDPTSKYRFGIGPVFATSVIYEFQVVDGMIRGVKYNYTDLNGKEIEGIYLDVPFVNMSYEKDSYKRIREQKKKSSSSVNSWTGILCSSWSGIEIQSIIKPQTSKTYHHLTIEENGAFTNGSTKFYVKGVDPFVTNPELRIYTIGGFNNTKTLIFHSLLSANTNVDRETMDSYTPQNDGIDGFCSFEIWSNGVSKYEYTSDYIVLQRKRTDNTFGKTLKVYYAKIFFYNRDEGTSIYNSYVDKLITFYNTTWQKQVIDYQINIGSPPSTIQNNYELSVNPVQNGTSYCFQYNDGVADCYESQKETRHIGTTANYKLFLQKITSSAQYTEDEFLHVELSHEFCHGFQYTFSNTIATNYDQKAWLIEGQARAIQSILYPDIEFKSDNYGDYVKDANIYILNFLNISWVPDKESYGYAYCLFWRFLYDNYNPTGTIKDKLAIFRETCKGFTAATIPAIEAHMNAKLNSTFSASKYTTMDAAIKEFSKRVLFNDPAYGLWDPCPSITFYQRPEMLSLTYDGTNETNPLNESIMSSFGMDYVVITLAKKGKAFINFNGDPSNKGNCPDYYLNLVELNGNTPLDNIIPAPGGVSTAEIETTVDNKTFFLVITRLDNKEGPAVPSTYSLKIGPTMPKGVLKANFSKVFKKAATTALQINGELTFNDESHPGDYEIKKWEWSFPGGVPSQVTQWSKSPVTIQYNDAGSFPVSLTITDASGAKDTKTNNDYVVVYAPGNQTNHTLEISAYNSCYATKNQTVLLTLKILTGTPPFHVYIWANPGMQGSVYFHDTYDTWFSVPYSWSEAGLKDVWYSVLDVNGCSADQHVSISIGMPGSHTVSFNYTCPTCSSTGIIGKNKQVFFHDATTGGYKPYSLWQWEYGKGINTGSLPHNTNTSWPNPPEGFPWESKWNNTRSLSFNGSPDYPVEFDEFDTYPITLIVYDDAGFQNSKTIYLKISAVEKCFCFNPEKLSHYNQKLKKHIVKFNSAQPTWLAYSKWHDDIFPWNTPASNNCKAKYPYNYLGYDLAASKKNAITNARYTLTKDNPNAPITPPHYNDMPQWYIDNFAPYPSSSNIYAPNYTNWVLNEHAYHYWDYWFWHYYTPMGTQNIVYPMGFTYQFPSQGVFNLRFEAWNKIAHPIASEITPGNSQNLDMYSFSDNKLYVVDCNATEYVNSNIVAGTYGDRLAGIFDFANVSPVNISSGATIVYQSCNYLLFRAGFTALSGSDFSAQVTNLQDNDDKYMEDYLIQSEVITRSMLEKPQIKQDFFSVLESTIEISPNPNKGVFKIQHSGIIQPSSIELYTLTGQKCNISIKSFDNEALIEIKNPVTTVYLLKMYTITGKLVSKKVIVVL